MKVNLVRLATCVALLVVSLGLTAQNFNRIHPPHLFDYEFQEIDSADYGYYLFTPFEIAGQGQSPSFSSVPMILDAHGYVLWYGRDAVPGTVSDLKYDAYHDQYYFSAAQPGLRNSSLVLDGNLQLVDSIRPANGLQQDQHDVHVRPDGVRIVHAERDSVFDLSAYTFGGQTGSATTHCRCQIIQELDPQNNLLWEWNSCDHLHPSLGYGFYGYDSTAFDYAHFNALDIEPNGNYLASYRHLNAIVEINRQTDSLNWILGGKANQFTFTNTPAFSGQHYVHLLPNGDISLFDNANMSTNNNSRALQLQLDTVAMTATRTFVYRPQPAFPARAMGSYQVTDSVQLINYGLIYRPRPTADLIDANLQLLKRVIFQDSAMSYRAVLYRPNTPIARPQITCFDSLGLPYLAAPQGHANYLWADGQTTRVVPAIATTMYQVWVPMGYGMVGSEPFFTAPTLPCLLTGIDPQVLQTAALLGTYDLLGRSVTRRQSGQVYLERYSDGKVRRVVAF